jgi:8-amino-7-oxononanoate synthase
MLTTLQKKLEAHKQNHLYRQRRAMSSPPSVKINCEGKEYISFCSNDYLGLANHPLVIKAFKDAADKYGVGSGASQLISGHNEAHRELEDAFAEFLQRDCALLFSNGYMANVGVINALINADDAIYADKLNHASLTDASILSRAEVNRYRHNDIDHLKFFLSKHSSKQKLIVTDAVFSMDGDIAALPELAAIAKQNQALLMVDDAHGIGVLGKTGRGTLEHFNLTQQDVPIVVCPLGKAFGSYGAIVAGSRTLIEGFIQFARSYIYTTATPPALACAAKMSLQLIMTETWRREKLFHLIKYFQKRVTELNLPIALADTPIQSFIVGSAQKAIQLSEKLLDKGFYVTAIRPPSVPRNSSRLRITLSCMHEERDIDAFLYELSECLL